MPKNDETVPEKAYELITEKLVKEALEKDKGQNAELISFDLKPFTKKGDNFLSIVVSVEASYKMEGSDYQESYVSKMNPSLPNNPLTESIEVMFPLETDMLLTIIGGMNEQLDKLFLPHIRTPKLYARTLESGRQTFIVDNLKRQGFKMCEITKGLDLDHAILVLKELGRFHASSLLYEETLHPKTIQESFNFKDPRFDDYEHEAFKFYETAMTSYGKVISDMLIKEGPKYEKCVKWLHDHSDKVAKYYHEGYAPEKPFDVLVHGDCRTSNFLFRYDGNDTPVDVRFLDFQFSRKASPATDLNYLFYMCLFGEFRVQKQNYMISEYYKSFSEVLLKAEKSPPFSYQELIQEVKNRRIFGHSSCILILSFTLAEDSDELFLKNFENEELDTSSEKKSRIEQALMDGENPLKEILLSVFDEIIN